MIKHAWAVFILSFFLFVANFSVFTNDSIAAPANGSMTEEVQPQPWRHYPEPLPFPHYPDTRIIATAKSGQKINSMGADSYCGYYYIEIVVQKILHFSGDEASSNIKTGENLIVKYDNALEVNQNDTLEIYGKDYTTMGPMQCVGSIYVYGTEAYIKRNDCSGWRASINATEPSGNLEFERYAFFTVEWNSETLPTEYGINIYIDTDTSFGGHVKIHPGEYYTRSGSKAFKELLLNDGVYYILVTLTDYYSGCVIYSYAPGSITIGGDSEPNSPPGAPDKPSGPDTGYTQEIYSFSSSSLDPDGDDVEYQYDWGDGELSDWGGPEQDHAWENAGDYSITVRARDTQGGISGWSEPKMISIYDNVNWLELENAYACGVSRDVDEQDQEQETNTILQKLEEKLIKDSVNSALEKTLNLLLGNPLTSYLTFLWKIYEKLAPIYEINMLFDENGNRITEGWGGYNIVKDRQKVFPFLKIDNWASNYKNASFTGIKPSLANAELFSSGRTDIKIPKPHLISAADEALIFDNIPEDRILLIVPKEPVEFIRNDICDKPLWNWLFTCSAILNWKDTVDYFITFTQWDDSKIFIVNPKSDSDDTLFFSDLATISRDLSYIHIPNISLAEQSYWCALIRDMSSENVVFQLKSIGVNSPDDNVNLAGAAVLDGDILHIPYLSYENYYLWIDFKIYSEGSKILFNLTDCNIYQ